MRKYALTSAYGRSQPQVEARSRTHVGSPDPRRAPGPRSTLPEPCYGAPRPRRTDPPRADHADARHAGHRSARLPDRQGGRAPLEAQTAADAAALAGARTIRDQLIAQVADHRHVGPRCASASRSCAPPRPTTRSATTARAGRLRRWTAPTCAPGSTRTTRLGRAPKDDARGAKAQGARAGRARRCSPSLGVGFGGGGGGRRHRRARTISDKEWKELAKDLHKPLELRRTSTVLGRLLQKHGAIPPSENARHGRRADAARRRAHDHVG